MAFSKRILQQSGRYALIDGIPFQLPVYCKNSPVLMAIFPIDAAKAASLIPGNEIHPLRLWKRALLAITVIDYRLTNIGKYIEFSVAIACTHGSKPAPRFIPAMMMDTYGVGQWVVDLPVSTEISVKGGKGIWGMPKHQANLNFIVGEQTVSSQYDLDGQFAMKIEISGPRAWLPIWASDANYCGFRGLLMKSYIHFKGRMGVTFRKKGAAKLTIGNHPRVQWLKNLDIDPKLLATCFIPEANGVLDDYFESWFLTFERPPHERPEGMENVVNLGQSQEWLEPPKPI